MKKKHHLIYTLGILFVTFGICVGLAELFVTSAFVNHSVWFLEKFFGPNHPPEYTFDQLYEYAADLTRHRNSQAYYYQSIICILLVVCGVILFLWGKDVRSNHRGALSKDKASS
jgi:hypothetical protein